MADDDHYQAATNWCTLSPTIFDGDWTTGVIEYWTKIATMTSRSPQFPYNLALYSNILLKLLTLMLHDYHNCSFDNSLMIVPIYYHVIMI
jgi:hypothetical protein